MNSLVDLGLSNRSSVIPELSFTVLDRLQHSRKGDMAVSLAVILTLLCGRFKVDIFDVLSYARNILNNTIDSSTHVQYKAIKEFLENEM